MLQCLLSLLTRPSHRAGDGTESAYGLRSLKHRVEQNVLHDAAQPARARLLLDRLRGHRSQCRGGKPAGRAAVRSVRRVPCHAGTGRRTRPRDVGSQQVDAARGEQVRVLLDERELWFLQDPDQVIFREGLQSGRDRDTTDKPFRNPNTRQLLGSTRSGKREGGGTDSGMRPNWTRSCGSTCSSNGLRSGCGESTCPARLKCAVATRLGSATAATATAAATAVLVALFCAAPP